MPTIDETEVAKFQAMAAEWWDPHGKFAPLHAMNPCRLDYLNTQVAGEFDRDLGTEAPFAGLRMLDIGCGGGLVAEPMARLGAVVTGIDASDGTIPVARAHAEATGLAIDYRHAAAEALVEAGEPAFDVVLAMEVVEHVADPAAFLAACAALLRPGGLLLASTLNRTARAYLLAVLGAERVLGWLPVGTHDWSKFVTPDELFAAMEEAGLEPVDRIGMVYDPLRRDWSLSRRDLSINYAAAAVKRG
jgi:2-polyprenyl-6-hydroxyphenyl methylase/3-demethylubiquinone-9 3-methyltransferase